MLDELAIALAIQGTTAAFVCVLYVVQAAVVRIFSTMTINKWISCSYFDDLLDLAIA